METTCSRRLASLLLGRSERTLRRWCDDGQMRSLGHDPAGRCLVDLHQVLELLGSEAPAMAERETFCRLVRQADAGDASAQTELGLLLLHGDRVPAGAQLLLDAAQQGRAEAMHWLWRCHQNGLGVEVNPDLALMWLHKAAAAGHAIALAQTRALRELAQQQLTRRISVPA